MKIAYLILAHHQPHHLARLINADVLPLAAMVLLGLHFWRIRKDGGLNRPDDIAEGELAGVPIDEKAEQAFPKDGTKTYGLMCAAEGRSPAVGPFA